MWIVTIKFRDKDKEDLELSNLKEIHYNFDGRGTIAFEQLRHGTNIKLQGIREFEAKELPEEEGE
jgi:hypothetical protein